MTNIERNFVKDLFTTESKTIEITYLNTMKNEPYKFYYPTSLFLKKFTFEDLERYFLNCDMIDYKLYKEDKFNVLMEDVYNI